MESYDETSDARPDPSQPSSEEHSKRYQARLESFRDAEFRRLNGLLNVGASPECSILCSEPPECELVTSGICVTSNHPD